MAKSKRRYACQSCGTVTHRWQGQCGDCGEWNSLVEESAPTAFTAKHDLSGGGGEPDIGQGGVLQSNLDGPIAGSVE